MIRIAHAILSSIDVRTKMRRVVVDDDTGKEGSYLTGANLDIGVRTPVRIPCFVLGIWYPRNYY